MEVPVKQFTIFNVPTDAYTETTWMTALPLDNAEMEDILQHATHLLEAHDDNIVDPEYARHSLTSKTNNFIFRRERLLDDGRRELLGFVTGCARKQGFARKRTAVVFNIDLVVCKRGQGSPIMNAFLYAELPVLAESVSPSRIVYELHAVANKVEFYRSLHFATMATEGELTTMIRIRNKSGLFLSRSDANSDEDWSCLL
eukprot:gene22304-25271_t